MSITFNLVCTKAALIFSTIEVVVSYWVMAQNNYFIVQRGFVKVHIQGVHALFPNLFKKIISQNTPKIPVLVPYIKKMTKTVGLFAGYLKRMIII